jgi:hypothetical protein
MRLVGVLAALVEHPQDLRGLDPCESLSAEQNAEFSLTENFAESEVDGYPAVRVDVASQSCGLIVWVSNEQTLGMDFTRVSKHAPGKGDPCGFAEQVTRDVIERLPDA